MHGRIDKVIEGGGRETGRRHLLDPRLLVAYCIRRHYPSLSLWSAASCAPALTGSYQDVCAWCLVLCKSWTICAIKFSHTNRPRAYHPPPPATPLPLLWSALSRSLVIFLTLHPVRTLAAAAAGPWLDINYQIRARNEPSRSFHNYGEVPY